MQLRPQLSTSATIEPVKRIAIVGSGGVGKSTFASQLGKVADIPVIHLDRHFWRPGWVETPREEWVELQAELLAGDSWIADGNYGGTFDVRFSRADALIVLSLPRWRCIGGALRRTVRHHGQDVQAADCPERFDLAFLRWIWRYPVDSRPRLDAAIDRHRETLRTIELTSRTQMKDFVAHWP